MTASAKTSTRSVRDPMAGPSGQATGPPRAGAASGRLGEAFDELARLGIPDLIARPRGGDGERAVRLWVPGCGTGTDAYALAMLFFEHFAAAPVRLNLQIFATDTDGAALETARRGHYSEADVARLSGERRRHFFVPIAKHRYQVTRSLRAAVTFAPQTLVSEAPCGQLDLIACRNVLPHLAPEVQATVMAVFHGALNDGGYLLLGPADPRPGGRGRFAPLAEGSPLYRRISHRSRRRTVAWHVADRQVEERRHMARELHDEIGGHMVGIGLLAQTLQAQLAAQGSPLAAAAQDVVDTVALAHKRLRGLIRGLVPVEAVPDGLAVALADLVAQCRAVTGIGCRLECDMPVPVDDPATALHLYRIAQEALNNALRHAGPREVVVALMRSRDGVEISVSDDGRGLPPAAAHDGFGLKSMRQRARLLGGACTFETRPGGGTVVRCRVPLTPSGPAGVGSDSSRHRP